MTNVPVTTVPGPRTWLVLVYRLPPGSTLRSLLRRRLTAAGAVYLANAVAAVPASSPAERVVRRSQAMVTAAGGSAQVLRASTLAGEPELVHTWNHAREQEYHQVIVGCAELTAAIGTATTAGDFHDVNLAEIAAGMRQLSKRYEKIRERDCLGAGNAAAAASALAAASAAVDGFADRVYCAESTCGLGRGSGRQSPLLPVFHCLPLQSGGCARTGSLPRPDSEDDARQAIGAPLGDPPQTLR